MHLFPYIDSLWFGEGFDQAQAGRGPDYWLVEMSGLPFGLTSELMAPANPWRGMLHGSAVRMLTHRPQRPQCTEQYWHGSRLCTRLQRRPLPPRPHATHATTLWRLWRAFGIESAAVHGYWESDPPIYISPVRAVSARPSVLMPELVPELGPPSGASGPPSCCDAVYVTSYVRPEGGGTLVSLASWATAPCNCSLRIAWVRYRAPTPVT